MSRTDMNLVLDDGMKTAIHFLQKNGEFFPFAAVKTRKGEIRHVQTLGYNERPASDLVIELLRSELRRAVLNDEYTTVAILSDVRLTEKETGVVTEAIRAEVEDFEAEPVTCYLPYTLVDGVFSLYDMKVEPGTAIVLAK